VLTTFEAVASVPAGLCATCRHARVLKSDRGSRFYRCTLSDTDPRYARYPLLPVTICEGYAEGDQGDQGDQGGRVGP